MKSDECVASNEWLRSVVDRGPSDARGSCRVVSGGQGRKTMRSRSNACMPEQSLVGDQVRGMHRTRLISQGESNKKMRVDGTYDKQTTTI